MPTTTLTSKGQITIPKEIHLRTGQEIEFYVSADGQIILQPRSQDIRTLRGILKSRRRPISLEEMEAAIAAGFSGATE